MSIWIRVLNKRKIKPYPLASYLRLLLLSRAPGRWVSVTTSLDGTSADNTGVDTAGDAVACGDEKLGECVALIDRGILDISLR